MSNKVAQMRIVRSCLQLALLAAGVFFSIATSPVSRTEVTVSDDTWIVENLYEGQTAVPRDHVIRLTVGNRDFADDGDTTDRSVRDRAQDAMERVLIYELETEEEVSQRVDVHDTYTLIEPLGLKSDTDYILDIGGIYDYITIERDFVPPIEFTTRPGPRVTGIWRNDDTLIVAFSESMDESTLTIAQDSVDLIWEKDEDLHSISADLNLADFVWEADNELFLLSPVDIFDSAWLKVARHVRGDSGARLDGNANGIAGEAGDDYLVEIEPSALPICYMREDIPMPCVSEEEVGAFVNQESSGGE